MTGSAAARPEALSQVIALAAAAHPARCALVGDDARWTFAQVEARTRSLAHLLRIAGILPGDRVAVARPKSAESFEAVHGILRAGAVVVPVDPLAPAAAARTVLADAGVRAVVGDLATITKLDVASVPGVDLVAVVATGVGDRADAVIEVAGVAVTPWEVALATPGEAADLPVVGPDDWAYLIYTSGSTGRPKGILHTHRSGLAYAERAAADHGLVADDRVAGMCPLHFDMSTLELYSAPLVGAAAVPMSEAALRMPASLAARCEAERCSVWYAVPFQLRQMTERGALDRRDLSCLRLVVYAGEPFAPGAIAQLWHHVPHVEIVNAYGPAEVNVVTTHRVPVDVASLPEVPIGRPWPDVDCRVVDSDGGAVPDGSVGELWVSSPTVMRGYWQRPDLDAGALVPRPDGPSWYRTGDLVVRDPDGLLWFRGRRDDQVKVRGVRIELDAVEGVLADAPGVVHAVVGAVGAPGDASHLGAAVVLRPGTALDIVALRRWCAGRLPAAAVPQHIEGRDSFPSTASGKIDRRAVRAELAATTNGTS